MILPLSTGFSVKRSFCWKMKFEFTTEHCIQESRIYKYWTLWGFHWTFHFWIFVKISNFRWVLDFRLDGEFGHRILTFFIKPWNIDENEVFVKYRIHVEFWNFVLNIEVVKNECCIFVVFEYWIFNILNFAAFGVRYLRAIDPSWWWWIDDELFLRNGWPTKGVYSLFLAGTIARGFHYCRSWRSRDQDLILRRMRVQTLWNEAVQYW